MYHYMHHSLSKEQETVGVLAPNSLVASALEPLSFTSVSTPCVKEHFTYSCVSFSVTHTDTHCQWAWIWFMLLWQASLSYLDVDRYCLSLSQTIYFWDQILKWKKKRIRFPFLTHQRPLQLEDCSCSKTVLWCHFPPQAPSTKRVWRTLLPMELPANEGRKFPALGVTFDLPLWAKMKIKVIQSLLMQNVTKMQRHQDIISVNLSKINRIMICKFRSYVKTYNRKGLPD